MPLLAGCAPELVQLAPNGDARGLPAVGQSVDVVVSAVRGADPLPVRGNGIAYAGLTGVLGRSVAAVASPWAERHRGAHADGWQLLVEIVRADAGARDGLLSVALEDRVTLRETVTQIHLGQTVGHCEVGGFPVSDGANAVYRCVDRLARTIAGWLEGLTP